MVYSRILGFTLRLYQYIIDSKVMEYQVQHELVQEEILLQRRNIMKNRSKKTWITGFLIIISSLLVIFGDRYFDVGSLEAKIATLTAVIGVIALWHQLKREKDFAEAEYILNLNEAFSGNSNIKCIYRKLQTYRDTEESQFTLEDKNNLMEYISFFSPIANLIQRDIMSYETINGFLSFRFFAVMNNPEVQTIAILPQKEHIGIILDLYEGWLAYRKKHDQKEPMDASSLQKNYPELFDLNKKKSNKKH
jgi:hypothetical protein